MAPNKCAWTFPQVLCFCPSHFQILQENHWCLWAWLLTIYSFSHDGSKLCKSKTLLSMWRQQLVEILNFYSFYQHSHERLKLMFIWGWVSQFLFLDECFQMSVEPFLKTSRCEHLVIALKSAFTYQEFQEFFYCLVYIEVIYSWRYLLIVFMLLYLYVNSHEDRIDMSCARGRRKLPRCIPVIIWICRKRGVIASFESWCHYFT